MIFFKKINISPDRWDTHVVINSLDNGQSYGIFKFSIHAVQTGAKNATFALSGAVLIVIPLLQYARNWRTTTKKFMQRSTNAFNIFFFFIVLFFNSIFTLIFYFCRSANIFTYIYMIFTCTCRLVTVWETQWMLYSPWKTWSAISVMLNRFLMQGMQNTWRSFTETAGRLVEREKNNLSDQKRLAHFRIPFQLVT